MKLIVIGRQIAPIYYRGGAAHGRDLWTSLRAEAAHYLTEQAALAVARDLIRWQSSPAGERRIESAPDT
jgi:hypothetical protein